MLTQRSAVVLLAVGFCAPVWADDKPPALEKAARDFARHLEHQDFEKAAANFDAVMKKVSPPEELKKFWDTLIEKLGPLKKVGAARTEKKGKYDFVYLPCEFEKAKLDLRVVFDREGKITGFQLVPPRSAHEYKAPDYVRPDSFTEKEVVVGMGQWKLSGTLALPKGDGPFPAVVLVHGSGPHDRDETIGPNKPFRDLAGGLASRGVAVLRYEKRTRAHGDDLVRGGVKLTLKEETIDDALSAAELLRKAEKIDPKRIFVLGHSLGAMAAPRIGERDPKLAGLILMAGNARPLEDLVVEQFTYLFSLGDGPTEEQKQELEKIKKQAARVKGPDLSPDTPREELPLGAPAAYWLALREYDQRATAARLKMPMLILQGERDYQVTMEDFEGWRKALAKKDNVTFKSYPDLNHLFMPGKGKATPAEYEKPGHVAGKVVKDIAGWIKAR